MSLDKPQSTILIEQHEQVCSRREKFFDDKAAAENSINNYYKFCPTINFEINVEWLLMRNIYFAREKLKMLKIKIIILAKKW